MVAEKKAKRRVNPFYVVLVLVGTIFALTACAYGVMAVKQMHASNQLLPSTAPEEGFVAFMDQEGPKVMLIELAILALATVGAIGTDRFWDSDA